ncbi:MAG: hypothetical protein AAF337_10625 [Pseudomonadota bacterium]
MFGALLQLLETPAFAYLILACLSVEAVCLLLLWKTRRIGVPPAQVLSFLGAGAGLAAGLLVLASDGPPLLLALALTASFVFHIGDVWLRWRS